MEKFNTLDSMIHTIAATAAEAAAAKAAKITEANLTWAAMVKKAATLLKNVEVTPEQQGALLEALEVERLAASKELGVTLIPPVVESARVKDGSRLDGLVPTKAGGYTNGSLRKRLFYILVFLDKRTPGILPPPPPKPAGKVVEAPAKVLVVGDSDFDRPDIEVRGKIDGRTAVGKAMRKLAKAQAKAL